MGRIVRRFGRFWKAEITDRLTQSRLIDVAIAEDAIGISIKETVDTVTLTGLLRGLHTEVELVGGAAGIVTGRTDGHLIEMYSEAANVHTGDVIGIFLNNYLLGTKTAAYTMLRLEENGTMVVDEAIFMGVTDISYFLTIRPNAPAALGWAVVGDITNTGADPSVGYLRVSTLVGDKAIPLYDM